MSGVVANIAQRETDEAGESCFRRGEMTREEYRTRLRAIEDEFAQRLRTMYLPENAEETSRIVYERAWSYGHASGYHEVENLYEELSAMVKAILQAEEAGRS